MLYIYNNTLDEKIDILHRIIKQYKFKERVSIVAKDKGELENGNIRVYVGHFK